VAVGDEPRGQQKEAVYGVDEGGADVVDPLLVAADVIADRGLDLMMERCARSTEGEFRLDVVGDDRLPPDAPRS